MAVAAACPEVYFLGARGSGEPATAAFHGLGAAVYKMVTVTQGILGVSHVKTFADVYDADSVYDLVPSKSEIKLFGLNPEIVAAYYYAHNVRRYLRSIKTGIAYAVSEAKLLHSLCPHAVLIMAGYSQGAMVMHQAELQLAASHDSGVLAQIAGTLLLADGDRVPHTAAREFGTSKSGAEGVRTWVRQNSGQDVADPATTANICNARDAVCDFSKSTIKSIRSAKAAAGVHTAYAKKDPALTEAAAWVAHLAERQLISAGKWSIQSVPAPPGSTQSQIVAVSCFSAPDCEAVGSYQNQAGDNLTLAEAWNGKTWTIQRTPNPANTVAGFTVSLNGVSCASAKDCEAVGSYQNPAGDSLTIAEVWNGTKWALQRSANRTGSDLRAVSCSSAEACEAVGTYSRGVLAEAWNGTAWKVQATSSMVSNGVPVLNSVSCASLNACEAIGEYFGAPLAEKWNGKVWKVQAIPHPADSGVSGLDGVACHSSARCEAAGWYSGATGLRTLAEIWNGSTWKIQATPNVGDASDNVLFAMSCSSSTDCEAVGVHGNTSTGPLFTLAEVWNGASWMIQPTPNPTSANVSYLYGVSCLSATDCEAVGPQLAERQS